MEHGGPQNKRNRLWLSVKRHKQKSWNLRKGVNATSRATGIVRGWFHRLHGKQDKRELEFCEGRQLERMRIASELHDTLLQGFLSASLVLEVALQELPEDSPTRASFRRAADLMHRAIEEGRAALQGLCSSGVAFGSLEQEFSDLLRETAPAGGVQARILVTGQPRVLRPEIHHQIYLIGREALVNAHRHSNATRIEAEIVYSRSHLRVVVRDNGCGIEERVLRSGLISHWGLSGMRERAKGIGAEVRIYSRRGAGTAVEISLPSHR